MLLRNAVLCRQLKLPSSAHVMTAPTGARERTCNGRYSLNVARRAAPAMNTPRLERYLPWSATYEQTNHSTFTNPGTGRRVPEKNNSAARGARQLRARHTQNDAKASTSSGYK